jgi:hypothetical protein
MAENEELNFVVRMLFPDNKVTLDTAPAEAQIAKLRSMYQQLRTEMGAGASVAPVGMPTAMPTSTPPAGYPMPSASKSYGFGPGQAPPFILDYNKRSNTTNVWRPGSAEYDRYSGTNTAPPPVDPRASATWATRPQYGPWNSSWGGNYGPQGSGGFSQGPIRDPGSWSQSSLSTGRGYDQAMLRQRVATANQYYGAADEASGSINKASIGINQLSGALTNLAAGIILVNKSAEQGADAWSNFQTRFIGGMNIAVGGGMALRGTQNLVSGAGGMALRGVNLAAGASTMMGMSGMAGMFGRMGAPLGMAGMAAGGVVVGAGAAVGGYLGYQLYQANQQNDAALARGQQLDAERVAFRDRQLFNMFGRAEHDARVRIGLNNEYSRSLHGAGAISFRDYDRQLTGGINHLMNRNAWLRSNWSTTNPSEESIGARVEIGRNLESLIPQVQGRGGERDAELRRRYLNIEQDRNGWIGEQDRHAGILRSGAFIRNRDWSRGLNAIRDAQLNGLNERNALTIAGTGGGMGGRARDWLEERAQGRIDALPSEWRDSDAKSSKQLEELKKQLKDAATEQQQLFKAIGENTVSTATVVRELKMQLERTNQEIWQMKGQVNPRGA